MQSASGRSSFLLVLLPGLMLGSTLVFTRFSLGQFAPLTQVALRLSLASLAFLVAYAVFRVRDWPTDRSLWMHSAIYGLIGTVLTMCSYTNSLRYQSSGVTSLLVTLSPIVTAIMAHLFLRDGSLNRLRWIGALISFAGAGLLLIRGESGLAELTQADWRGYAWAIMGVLSNSAGLVYARRYLNTADPFVVTSIRILVGALTVAALTAATVGFDFSRVQLSGVMALLYAAIVGTFFAFLFYLTAVQRLGATVASQTEYVVPMIATLLGVLLLGERVTPTMGVGMLVITIGLWVFDKGRNGSAETSAAGKRAAATSSSRKSA